MAQLNVRLDDDTRDSFDALARARGLSASDLIRDLIDNALGRGDPNRPRGDLVPPSLTAIERRAFALQHEILAHLATDPDEKDGGWEAGYHRGMVDVLNKGYTTEYSDMFQEIQPEMTRREASLVHDILDMFTMVEWSLGRLSTADRASLGESAEHTLTFRGFDFNNSQESRLASFARYVISTDRWEGMAEHFDSKHERGNSHWPMLATYERMLTVWRPLKQEKANNFATRGGPDQYALTLDELMQIRDAAPYPKG